MSQRRRFWMTILFAGAAMSQMGCGAEMVETRKRIKGPVEAVGWIDAGGGEIKYALWGTQSMVLRRRQSALEQIAEYCGSAAKYKIVDEVERSDAEASYSGADVEENIGSGGKHYQMRGYRHVYFECTP